MIDNGRSRSQMTFRLWNGRVTRYKGENFIFPSFFLPVRQTADPEPKKAEEIRPQAGAGAVETPPEQKTDPPTVTSDPNDVLDIPDDLYEKLRAVREIMAARERRTEDRNEEPTVEPNQPDESRDQPESVTMAVLSSSLILSGSKFGGNPCICCRARRWNWPNRRYPPISSRLDLE